LTRSSPGWGPGETGSAVLDAIFLTPAGSGSQAALSTAPASQWQSLCGRRYQWVEILGS
jgi:hypothetical protein